MMVRSNDSLYRLSILRKPEEWDEQRLRQRWDELIRESSNVNAIYSSPIWFDLLRDRHGAEKLAVAVAHDSDGKVAGITPILFEDYPFQFYVSRYPLLTRKLRAAHILGSVPMLPADPHTWSRLIQLLLSDVCECVYMDTVPTENPFLELTINTLRSDYLVYAPGGSRPWHLRRIPGSSQEYLAEMSSKTRSTLKKKAKKLSEAAGGKLEVMRIDTAHQVQDFLNDAVTVSQNSWQHQILGKRISNSERELAWAKNAAKADLLRNYLLKCGDRACAFVVGYQFNGVFHDVELGYDREFSEHSPGTILLHMLIQDLCDHRQPELLNFGMGDADYKRRFGNVERRDTSVVVLSKTLNKHVLTLGHASFRFCVRMVRDVVCKVTGKPNNGRVSRM